MKKKIRFWDLVFMNVSALFGIRWIAKSTAESFGLGLGAIPTWIIFAFIFFVPGALICAELASTYPADGGLYQWVKEAYGEKYGFLVSWLNWTAKIFWYSSFLTFLAVNISYVIGKQDLADNKIFILLTSLILFWGLSLISTRGMGFAKIFTRFGALGSTVPAILLIGMAFISIVILKKQPSASLYTVATLTPQLNVNSLVAISGIMFGLSGAEITSNFITEIDNPSKNFPKAIMVAAAIVSALYVLGSISITMILPPDKITSSKGILDALNVVATLLGIGPWFIRVVAFGISLSIFGTIILYIVSPIKMLFGSVRKGVFSEKLTTVNENNIPVRAVLLQGIIVSLILLITTLLPSVDAIYNALLTMTALTSLFPYALLFASYIKLRKERPNEKREYSMARNNNICIYIATMVLAITVIGILLSAAPVMKTLKENIIYEVEMIGGGFLIILLGLKIWDRFVRRTGFKEEVRNINNSL